MERFNRPKYKLSNTQSIQSFLRKAYCHNESYTFDLTTSVVGYWPGLVTRTWVMTHKTKTKTNRTINDEIKLYSYFMGHDPKFFWGHDPDPVTIHNTINHHFQIKNLTVWF